MSKEEILSCDLEVEWAALLGFSAVLVQLSGFLCAAIWKQPAVLVRVSVGLLHLVSCIDFDELIEFVILR